MASIEKTQAAAAAESGRFRLSMAMDTRAALWFWFLSANVIFWLAFFGGSPGTEFQKIVYPVILVGAIVVPLIAFLKKQEQRTAVAYALFFLISLTSLTGATQTLTGSHATSTNLAYYGLSFYTATIAFHLHKGRIAPSSIIHAINPMLLFTGPIATVHKPIAWIKLGRRVVHFLPYALTGFFFFRIVASELGNFLWMIDYTDPVRALAFAGVFELFVYFNFAGLSLIVYAFFGIVGLRVPLNFMQPFTARNLVEFWRGWHISLSTVLKQLFYDPVRGKFGLPAALFLVYISSALWHGVSVNFLIWGAFHAGCFLLTVKMLKRGWAAGALALMIFAIVYGRMLFADSDALRLFAKMAMFWPSTGVEAITVPVTAWIALGIAVGLVAIEFLGRNHKYVRQRRYKFLRLPVAQFAMVVCIVLLIQRGGGADYAVYGQR